MLRSKLALVLGGGVLTFCLVACQADPQPEVIEPTATPIVTLAAPRPTAQAPVLPDRQGLSAEETAQAFYDWYTSALEHTFREGVTLDWESIGTSGYLAPELWFRIQAERAAAGALGGADPFLCAQDVPHSIEVTAESLSDTHAKLAVTSEWAGHRITLEMAEHEDLWRLVGIRCGTGEAEQADSTGEASTRAAGSSDVRPAREGWQIYANPKLGYHLSYPADWTHQEHTNQPDQPPIGPEQVQVMTLIMPRTWADAMTQRQGPPDPNAPVIAPFTLEVVRCTADELYQIYPTPTYTEAYDLGQYQGTRAVEVLTEDLSLIHYVAQHPNDPELWLVFTDPISGFPDRLINNELTVATFAQILDTLQMN